MPQYWQHVYIVKYFEPVLNLGEKKNESRIDGDSTDRPRINRDRFWTFIVTQTWPETGNGLLIPSVLFSKQLVQVFLLH